MPARTPRPLVTALVAVALSSLALSACAGSESRNQKIVEKARERFAAADINHDGLLDPDEAAKGMPRIASHFAEIDSNKDGRLSPEEILGWIQQRRGTH